MSVPDEKVRELHAAIADLEAQRPVLGDSVVEPAVTLLRQQLAELEARLRALATEEERKIVTILFADVSGFSALSEQLDPEEVRNLINACFERLVPIVEKYQGTVDKFMGDEIMALFGAPIAHENDPERALRAALEMMETIAAFNRERASALDIHIGVNTGHVIAGKIGARGRRVSARR
jgi:class 3 adenylate cyclase